MYCVLHPTLQVQRLTFTMNVFILILGDLSLIMLHYTLSESSYNGKCEETSSGRELIFRFKLPHFELDQLNMEVPVDPLLISNANFFLIRSYK